MFKNCCSPIIAGLAAETAEQLMRSRYSAYVLGEWEYLLATWHPTTRPAYPSRDAAEWLGLNVLKCDLGTADDGEGLVEFVASFREKGKVLGLHEVSRFVQEQGRWYYVDGQCRIKTCGRNDPCPCGSGRKTKHCCAKAQ